MSELLPTREDTEFMTWLKQVWEEHTGECIENPDDIEPEVWQELKELYDDDSLVEREEAVISAIYAAIGKDREQELFNEGLKRFYRNDPI